MVTVIGVTVATVVDDVDDEIVRIGNGFRLFDELVSGCNTILQIQIFNASKFILKGGEEYLSVNLHLLKLFSKEKLILQKIHLN